jgi:two-component system response regulator NreC
MSIRIVIADDHRILRAGLKTYLSSDLNLEIVGEATTFEESIQQVNELHPDILLMDIGMPGMDGLDALQKLKKTAPETRILVLTMHEDSALVQAYIHAGASGYIIKRAAESELIDAIYAVWRGIIYVHPSLMRSLVAPHLDISPGQFQPEKLTSREAEVLRLIVQGYTNRQIAASLNISVRTVETHRGNIMDKLNLHSRVDLVRYAAQHGLVKMDDLPPKDHQIH